uniref:Uncharacterized protein n=1 Tax=Anguilla anguilla TaxID=7936 RepID=A0A0E9TNI0_ANGAN
MSHHNALLSLESHVSYCSSAGPGRGRIDQWFRLKNLWCLPLTCLL